MATKNLSEYDSSLISYAKNIRFGIVKAEWNNEITGALYNGAYNTLIKHGVNKKDIISLNVPGTFELTFGASSMIKNTKVDAIIVLGCVIQGETPHFTYICQGVTQGITQLNLDYKIPVIFGVLTTDNIEQAKARAGGKLGNKGDEAAITAIKMVNLIN